MRKNQVYTKIKKVLRNVLLKDSGGFNDESKKVTDKSSFKMYTRFTKCKMRGILRKICNEDKDMCPGKVNVSKNKICDETKVCDDVSPSISLLIDIMIITKR